MFPYKARQCWLIFQPALLNIHNFIPGSSHGWQPTINPGVLRQHRQKRSKESCCYSPSWWWRNIKIWNHDPCIPLHHSCSHNPPLLPVLLCEGGSGVWESSHLQTWKTEERRSFWTRLVLHPAMHWQVFLCWPQNCLIRGSSSRNVVQRLCHCQCGRCLLLQGCNY